MGRKSENPKARLRKQEPLEMRKRLSVRVHYIGNPAHKKNPGDFNLSPPSSPRLDKTLCDGCGVFEKAIALGLLRRGVMKGLISSQTRNEFPQMIWAVSDSGVPLEARLENQEQGTYHGYPILQGHPLRKIILDTWNSDPSL